MRVKDLAMRRDAAGHPNMDWTRWKEWEKMAHLNYKTSQVSTWENFGPYTKSGRIIAIAFHPTDSNTMYAGSASGGLWRTTDYGNTWTPLTDNYPTMGIGAVVINPKNPSTIIIATGEGYSFGNEFTSGFGILISHNSGQTWNLTNVTAQLAESFAGMDIIWNPNDTMKVCVATSFGIYFSNDGGKNYSYVLDRMPSRIIQDPKNPNNLYLTARYYSPTYPGGFYRSSNNGQNWTLVAAAGLPSLTDMGYASIAVHPVYNNIIFLNISKSSVNGMGPMVGLFKSNDFGNTFSQIPTNVDVHCYPPPYEYLCQGWYDNTIVISPADTNILFAGGMRLWKSTDGGKNWTVCDRDSSGTAYAVHPDHHQTWFHPLSGHLIDCNDGGINYSSDLGVKWTNISDGLITHQFYSVAFAETDSEIVIGGAQDVGIFSSKKSLTITNWENEYSGDAFGCAVDRQNENVWYASLYINLMRIKSNDTGLNWSQINNGTSSSDQWRMPMVMHPTDNQTLLSSNTDNMYKTTNGGTNWQAVSANGNIECFEFDKINPNIIYASELFGATMYLSTDGGSSWSQLASSPGSPITDLAADTKNTEVVYASIGSFGNNNQVFKSINSGTSWTNISNNLPAVPANTLVVDPRNDSVIYVGNDLGVWVSENAGSSWLTFNNGLPPVVVEDIHFYQPDTTIRIGTYGRGYWRTKALPVNSSTAIREQLQMNFISVQPNPVMAGSAFFVKQFSSYEKKESFKVTLSGQLGNVIYQVEKNGKTELSLKAPSSAGLYFLHIHSTNANYSFKIAVFD